MGKSRRQRGRSRFCNDPANEYGTRYDKGPYYDGPYNSFRSGNSQLFQQNSRYVKHFQNNRGRFPFKHDFRRSDNKKKRPPSRAHSPPKLGSKEYMEQKIEQTSAIIMQQLLNPTTCMQEKANSFERNKEVFASSSHSTPNNQFSDKEHETSHEKSSEQQKTKKKMLRKVEEIQKSIMSHLSNLANGRKKNLINSQTSGYDIAIQQIVKQQRLEISRALRNMCLEENQNPKSTEFINSIIPDMGIKIEELPHEIIKELSNVFDFDQEYDGNSRFSSVIGEIEGHSAGKDQFLINGLVDIINVSDSDDSVCTENAASTNFEQSLKNQSDTQIESTFTEIKEEPEESDLRMSVEIEDSELNTNNTARSNEVQNTDLLNESKSEVELEKQFNSQPDTQIESEVTKMKEELEESDSRTVVEDPQLNIDNTVNANEVRNLDESKIEIGEELLQYRGESGDQDSKELLDIKNVVKQEPLEELQEIMNLSDLQSLNEVAHETMVGSIVKEESENCEVVHNVFCDKPDENIDESKQQESKTSLKAKKVKKKRTQKKKSKGVQTQYRTKTIDSLVQTDPVNEIWSIEKFVQRNLPSVPSTFKGAVDQMLQIDDWILHLTNYRQKMFKAINSADNNQVTEITGKKRKIDDIADKNNEVLKGCEAGTSSHNQEGYTDYGVEEITVNDISVNCNRFLDLQDVEERMWVLQVFEDKLVAGAESGKIFICNLTDGHFAHILHTCISPISSIAFSSAGDELTANSASTYMYIASFQGMLQSYDFHSFESDNNINVDYGIECMESKWGYVFIGGTRGWLLRYSVKKSAFEYEDKFNDNTILVIKATLEGSRRILLVGPQESPVCIRDAMTGLHLRIMEDFQASSVYSIIIEKNLVYCSATDRSVLAFSFHNGSILKRFKICGSNGKRCIKIRGSLLFISGHSENIHVYNIETENLIATIQGPGGKILSMEIVNRQVVVGTSSSLFKALTIPQNILDNR